MSVLEYWGVRKQCSDGGGTVKLAHYSYSDNLHNNYFGLFRGEKRKKKIIVLLLIMSAWKMAKYPSSRHYKSLCFHFPCVACFYLLVLVYNTEGRVLIIMVIMMVSRRISNLLADYRDSI